MAASVGGGQEGGYEHARGAKAIQQPELPLQCLPGAAAKPGRVVGATDPNLPYLPLLPPPSPPIRRARTPEE